MAGEPLTQEELSKLYADPRTEERAINLVFGSHDNTTIGEVRDQLRAMLAEIPQEATATVEAISRQAALDAIPSTWLDNLLSGDGKVIHKSPCPEIEALLNQIRQRIAALPAIE